MMVRSYASVGSSDRLWAEDEMARSKGKKIDTRLSPFSLFVFISRTCLSFYSLIHPLLACGTPFYTVTVFST